MNVVRWTNWDDVTAAVIPSEADFREAFDAVVKEIAAKGYNFSGLYHQNGKRGVPVLSDGRKLCVSMRTWGRIMAVAHGDTSPEGYLQWAWGDDDTDKNTKLPE